MPPTALNRPAGPLVPPVRLSLGRAIACAALTIAMIYLLCFHIAPGAPMRLAGRATTPAALAEQRFALAAADVSDAAGTGNVQLRFGDPGLLAGGGEMLFTEFYYCAAYRLYPRRVVIGYDDRVINFPVDLFAADASPPDDWLRQHGVTAQAKFAVGDDGQVRFTQRRVP